MKQLEQGLKTHITEELTDFIDTLGTHPSYDEISASGDVVYSYTKTWDESKTDQYIIYYYKYQYYIVGTRYKFPNIEEQRHRYQILSNLDSSHIQNLNPYFPEQECIRFDPLTTEQVNSLRKVWEELI